MVKFAASCSQLTEWIKERVIMTGLGQSQPPLESQLFRHLPITLDLSFLEMFIDASPNPFYYSSLNGWVFVDLLFARSSCWELGWRHGLAFRSPAVTSTSYWGDSSVSSLPGLHPSPHLPHSSSQALSQLEMTEVLTFLLTF